MKKIYVTFLYIFFIMTVNLCATLNFSITNLPSKLYIYHSGSFTINVVSNNSIVTDITMKIKVSAYRSTITTIETEWTTLSSTTKLKSKNKWQEGKSTVEGTGHTYIINGSCEISEIEDTVKGTVAIVVEDAREGIPDSERIPSITNIIEISSPDSEYTGSLVINELFYKTETFWDREWIEIYNLSDNFISLTNFYIVISGKTNYFDTALVGSVGIKPRSYAVLCVSSDITNWFPELKENTNISVITKKPAGSSFKNETGKSEKGISTSGTISLFDAHSNMIDIVNYESSWHEGEDFTSLERINPLFSPLSSGNWAVSLDPSGATPGRRNSVTFESYLTTSTAPSDVDFVHLSKKSFNPLKGYLNFYVKLKKGTWKLQIRVFTVDGYEVYSYTEEKNPAEDRTYSFAYGGTNSGGDYLTTGIYILYVSATNTETGEVLKTSKTFAIGYFK